MVIHMESGFCRPSRSAVLPLKYGAAVREDTVPRGKTGRAMDRPSSNHHVGQIKRQDREKGDQGRHQELKPNHNGSSPALKKGQSQPGLFRKADHAGDGGVHIIAANPDRPLAALGLANELAENMIEFVSLFEIDIVPAIGDDAQGR